MGIGSYRCMDDDSAVDARLAESVAREELHLQCVEFRVGEHARLAQVGQFLKLVCDRGRSGAAR